MLTAEQIENFKKDGVLILRDFFNAEEINAWRDEVYDFYRKPGDYEEWQEAINNYPGLDFRLKYEPSPENHAKMESLFNCFNSSIHWEGENEMVPRSPQINAEWLGASSPHLDYPIYPQKRLLVNTVFYLHDVSSYDGPFMYWKGSHKNTWEYFRRRPSEYCTPRYLNQEQTFEMLTRMMEKDPVAFYAKAGDLLIWHPLLLHSPSINISYHPRLAFVGRWGAALGNNEPCFDFSGDMWQNWQFSTIEAPEMLNIA